MAQPTCAVDGCTRPGPFTRGWCRLHYRRWHDHGDPGPVEFLLQKAKGHICSIADCELPAKSYGWCKVHYARWKRHGDPTVTLKPRRRQAVMDALLQAGATATSDECVIMDRLSNPRPLVVFQGRTMTASRAVWIIANGDPGEDLVLHTCNGGSGTNGCINIRHLYRGDYFDNARDRWSNR